jgi:imidazolonepropionase-like amidohydrolase
VDVVKIGASTGPRAEGFGSIPTLTVEEIRTVCDTAHGLGLPVAAHAIGSEAVRRCVVGGVDTIEHGYGLSNEVCDLVAASHAWIVPTLRTRATRPTAEARATSREQMDTLRRGVTAGIRYAAGTDSVGDDYTLHGPGNALEIELMGRVLSPHEALMAGTRDSARMLRLDGEVGTLEAGKFADLIAVDRDPRHDLSVLQRVRFVMRGGRVVRHDADATKR